MANGGHHRNSNLAISPIAMFTMFIIWLASRSTIDAQEIDIDKVIPSGYNAASRPPADNDTLEVFISVYVNELLQVNEGKSFQVDMFLTQEWLDPRLNGRLGVRDFDRDFVITQPDFVKRFWTPDIFFVNSIDAHLIRAIEAVQVLTIGPDGSMHYVARFNATFHCEMNLRNYPHDYHHCSFRLSSLRYNESSLRLIWSTFDVQSGVEYPKFKIRSWWTEECDRTAVPISTAAATDLLFANASCRAGTLKLVRRLSYYVVRYYTLSFLLVLVSFGAFSMPVNAWPARASLVVTPLLALITMDVTIKSGIKVAYTVSLHIWMMFVEGFVYMVGIEFAIAIAWAHLTNDKTRFAKRLKLVKAKQQTISTIIPIPPPPPRPQLSGYYFGNRSCFTAFGRLFDRLVSTIFGEVDFVRDPFWRNKVDYVSRVLFPVTFLLFVIVYILATTIEWSVNYN